MRSNKKAGHGALILGITMMFIGTFIFAVTLEFGLDLVSSGFQMQKDVNNKFATDFNVVAVYTYGVSDGSIDGGKDNITITAQLGKDSKQIKIEELQIKLISQNLKDTFEFKAGTVLDSSTYTYEYENKGTQFKDGFLSENDLISMKMQLPNGYSIDEGTYMVLDVIYTRRNTNVPIRFTLPSSLTKEKTMVYPWTD